MEGNEDPRLHLLMLDLVQHLGFIFSGMVKCIGEEEASAIPSVLKAYNYILKWREIDPLSKGLPVGPFRGGGHSVGVTECTRWG